MTAVHWRHKNDKEREPIPYTACGLDDVFLISGYEITETEHGKGLVVKDLDDLLRAISLHLAMKRELTGKEVRFLRRQMDITQAHLGRYVGLSPQQVARWEKGESQITDSAAAILRLLVLDHVSGKVSVRKKLDEIIETDAATTNKRTIYQKTDEGWRKKAA